MALNENTSYTQYLQGLVIQRDKEKENMRKTIEDLEVEIGCLGKTIQALWERYEKLNKWYEQEKEKNKKLHRELRYWRSGMR